MSNRAAEKKGPKMRIPELIILILPLLAIAANVYGVAELIKIARPRAITPMARVPSGSSAFSARRSWSA